MSTTTYLLDPRDGSPMKERKPNNKFAPGLDITKMIIGDKFKHGTLFAGLTKERVEWELVAKGNNIWTFTGRYMGVLYGTMRLTVGRDGRTPQLMESII